MLRQRRPVEHLVGEVLMASSSVLEIAEASMGGGMTVTATCTMVDVTIVAEDVGAVGVEVGVEAAIGSVGVGQEVDATVGSVGAAVGSVTEVAGTMYAGGVDGGGAVVVGVEGASEVDEEGADDRVAGAIVLRVLHIPAFASSIIRSRRSMSASSPAMAATDSVDRDWAIPKHQADDPDGRLMSTVTSQPRQLKSDELGEIFPKLHQIK